MNLFVLGIPVLLVVAQYVLADVRRRSEPEPCLGVRGLGNCN